VRAVFLYPFLGGENMKVRVIRQFNDKTEGLINRPINEVFECSEQRAKELIDGGFAEEVKPDAPKKPRAKAVKTEKTEKAD
jgi:hypothetical protein